MKTVQMNAVKIATLFALACSALMANAESISADKVATLRQAPINIEMTPPPLGNDVDNQGSYGRAYPTQAPLIPHKVDHYRIDLKTNQCMSCHDRDQVQESKAPMVSITHYWDRDNNVLAQVSPRRYFCTQCHVPQDADKPLVENIFIDVDQLIKADVAMKRVQH
ncbi:MAG: nitrate reductase cytochrome c-type subunit [Shewanella sp.]|nr:nitrate reductase cytochrome c-type subunit [Shewanella sp.]